MKKNILILCFLVESMAWAYGNIGVNVLNPERCRTIIALASQSCSAVSVQWDHETNGLACYCDGTKFTGQTNATCPDPGSQKIKKPIPIVSEYGVTCRNLSYFGQDQNSGGGITWTSTNNPLYPVIAGGLADTTKPLRMCWVGWNTNHGIRGSYIKGNTYDLCGFGPSDRSVTSPAVPLHILVSCPHNTDNDKKCRDILKNMIEGKVTFRPGEARTDPSFYCDPGDPGICQNTHNYKKNDGHRPNRAIYKELYDRRTNTYTGDFVTLYAHDESYFLNPRRAMADMQCLSNNIRFRDVCNCNNGDYEFGIGEDSTCDCPDGTPKDKDGNCAGVTASRCPDPNTDSLSKGLTNKRDLCTCTCPNDQNKTINISLDNTSCPSTLTAFKANPTNWNNSFDGTECDPDDPPPPSLTCPADPPHIGVSTKNPGGDPICAEGDLVITNTTPPEKFCKQDQNCETQEGGDVETRACNNVTQSTNYGACTKTAKVWWGGTASKCLTFSNTGVTTENADSAGNCPAGKTPVNATEVFGLCGGEGVPLDHVCTNDGIVMVVQDVANANQNRCICVTPGSFQYTCNQGVPNSQDSTCKCEGIRVTSKTCDPGYTRNLGTSPGTCDCPDSSWAKAGTTCSKAAGRDITLPVVKEAQYECLNGIARLGAGAETPIPGVPSAPQTLAAAIVDGWSCNHGCATNIIESYPINCRKTVYATTKLCTDGGTYNPNPPPAGQCEISCVQNPTVDSCECTKRTASTVCTCPFGWVKFGSTECKKTAPPSPPTCNCECYENAHKDLSFSPGDSVYTAIIADSTKCTLRATCGVECYHNCERYTQCPPNPPSPLPAPNFPDNVRPDDPSCKKCPDGNAVPSLPGGCCPDGTAIMSDVKNCPTSDAPYAGGNPKGVDIAFGTSDFSSVVSVYSAGSMDKPDYICWQLNNEGKKMQQRDLFCPSQSDCGGGDRDLDTKKCRCQSMKTPTVRMSHENTVCEYTSVDPMRFEQGRPEENNNNNNNNNESWQNRVKFYKTSPIVTP